MAAEADFHENLAHQHAPVWAMEYGAARSLRHYIALHELTL
jgi:hypothetical protein